MTAHPPLPLSESGLTPVDVARACAAQAGEIIRDGFGQAAVSAVKGRGNVVTLIDLAVEMACRKTIATEYPDHAILSEETASDVRAGGWMWVIDPVDGTKNFSRGIPHFCFTVALCYDAEPLVGLTLHPLLDDEFLAVAGEGVTLNGRKPELDLDLGLADAVVAIDLGYEIDRGALNLDLAKVLWPNIQSLRVPGSAAMDAANLAAGRWDLFVHSSLEPWDIAAGLLLLREAGCEAMTRDGRRAGIYDDAIVAGNPRILREFNELAGHLPWRS